MKILITGSGGQFGTDLADVCRASGDEVTAADSATLDVTDRDQVLAAVTSAVPEVIVNAAAWTAVDACESDVDKAFRVNALGPRWLADAADRVGAHLVQVSTDYVFDGTKNEAYHEWDITNPQSVYGASKLAGEREALAASSSAVVRTAWLMGVHGANMLKTVWSLRDRDDLAFVDDQRGCPTFTDDLAVAVRRLAVSRLAGTYHLTNAGSVTWYEFVREVLIAVGASPEHVRPVSTADLDPPRPAPRPANSVLANAAWIGAGMDALPEYREPLERALAVLRTR